MMVRDILQNALREEADAIVHLANTLDASHIEAVEWMFHCSGRVITCGIGKSGHIARKTAGTLASTGTPSLFLHAAEAVHGDLGMVTNQDIVLLYSHSGETQELIELFPTLKAIGAKTILMTGRLQSSAAQFADLAISTFVTEEACPNNLAPTSSTTAMLALSDALAIAVMNLRKFGKEDFAKFHPSGTLGRRLLLRVSDVMRTGEDIAIIGPDTPILTVMKSISSAGVGAACVAQDAVFLGLISDGDLRRHISTHSEPLNAVAADLMNPNAATIPSDLLATEAIEIFQNHPKKIGEMPVIADQKLVGLLTLKDLLRAGII